MTKLTAYWSNGAASCAVKGFIYSDVEGVATNLLGTTDAVSVSANQSVDWHDLTFSTPVELSAGAYWLGVIGDTGATTFDQKYAATGEIHVAYDTYATGPEATFGALLADDPYDTAIYATYTPDAPAGFTGLTVTRPLNEA